MDLKPIISFDPHLDIFESSRDELEIQSLMKKSPMNVGGISLLYDRSPHFQSLLRLQSSQFATFLGRNLQKKIMGVSSVSWRPCWLNGKKVSVGYLGDFRTDLSRRSALLWRKSYGQILENLINLEPQYFLTAILKKNKEAIHSLVDSKRDKNFHYDFLEEVSMVNVYGRVPFYKVVSKDSLKVVPAQPEDLRPLKEFLNRHESKKIFGAIFDGSDQDDWNYREKNWPGFSLEKFLLIKDVHQKIIAACLPWDPSSAKRMTVIRAPSAFTTILKLLKLCGVQAPQVGQSLKIIYLTHFNFESGDRSESRSGADIMAAFLDYSLKNFRSAHMISWADHHIFEKPLKGFIEQRTPVLLYSVRTSDMTPLPRQPGQRISFEMSLV